MPSTGTNRISSFSILLQLVLSRDFLFHCICLYRKNNLVTTVRKDFFGTKGMEYFWQLLAFPRLKLGFY